MTVGEIVYRVLGDDTQFKRVMGNVGNTASKALGAASKAALAVTSAAAAAVSALAKSAVSSFADYEQLAGGAELMFGEAYDFIAEKAKTAFKDIQMSQNEYLEQVNGFAIGLKTAMGGDEIGAAKLADRIVTAEADIVAATGNTAENVQNAFNGIMKNNYTMLDNLQIGITPTKEGFQELIDTVNAYKAAHGEATNYVIDNLADCQNALVDYIEMQGLSGYAQAEGAKTLSGSMASMNAAWQNLLTGMADPTQDFDELVSNLVDSILNVSDNLMPRIMAVLPQMATGITELAEDLLPLIPETLEEMLPGVLEGANNLISALLDTLSSVADTAIPIVTENADEIIDTLLSGLVSAVPNLASKAADLCTALITAILDNADIITQGAVDIVTALAEGIGNNLDTLIPAAIKAVLAIVDTLIYNIDEILGAAEELIKGLADGLIQALPELIAKAPEIVIDLIVALVEAIPDTIEFAVELCDRIVSNLVNYDWESAGSEMYSNLSDAIVNALNGDKDYTEKAAQEKAERIKRYSNLTVEQIDKMSSDAARKLGELNDVFNSFLNSESGEYDISAMPQWMRTEMEMSGKSFEEYFSDQIANTEQLIEDLADAKVNAISEIDKNNEEIAEAIDGYSLSENFGNGAADRAEKEAKKHFGVYSDAAEEETAKLLLTGDELKEAITKIDNAYDLGNYSSEKAYWADRLDLLEANRNEEDQAWIDYYSQTKAHYEKAIETEARAAESAAKEAESNLKTAVQEKFRDLETEQLENRYDDSWLLEQERAFIETLDHNSDVYKEYNLKLLQEQKKSDEAAENEVKDTAEKQKNALEKAYESVVKSRDSLADSMALGGDIFQSSEETDKRTGEKSKNRSINIEDFEKKIAAKKKLTSKIAELLEKNTPDEIISQLLKADPEDALYYANELLRSPDKLSRLSKGFENDEAYSNIIANMVTEKSEDFSALGTEAGNLFGESFMAAFRENWETAFDGVFDDEYTVNASAQVKAANASAANESTYVRRDYAAEMSENSDSAKKSSFASNSSGTYKIVDLNGKYVATVVNNENKRTATRGGG